MKIIEFSSCLDKHRSTELKVSNNKICTSLSYLCYHGDIMGWTSLTELCSSTVLHSMQCSAAGCWHRHLLVSHSWGTSLCFTAFPLFLLNKLLPKWYKIVNTDFEQSDFLQILNSFFLYFFACTWAAAEASSGLSGVSCK